MVRESVKRVLIANRGEIAARILRACRVAGLEAVAVYSTADRDAPYLSQADRAVCIGPPAAARSYLLADALLAAALGTGCDAIHPGYGFMAENAGFARRCAEHGLTFIGPSPEAIELMGDKIAGRAAAIASGVPVVPGSDASITDTDAAKRGAADIGYPLLLKASAGGGGRGHAGGERAVRARVAARRGRRRGASRVLRLAHLHGALLPAGPPRRGPGLRRPARQPRAPRRARLQRAAAPPEARRGIPVARAPSRAARRDLRRRGQPRARGRLRERRHRRVHLRPRRRALLLHRDEYANSGRAPGDGDGDRHRPGAGAASRRRRQTALVHAAIRCAPRPRHRVAHQRGGSRARVSPDPGPPHPLVATHAGPGRAGRLGPSSARVRP